MPEVYGKPALAWRYVAIVGAEAEKFSVWAEETARNLIKYLVAPPNVIVMSGGCPLGGVDIWAEEEYEPFRLAEGRPAAIVHKPKTRDWDFGFKPRNELIAQGCTELHNIVVSRYIPTYSGRQFPLCYHCARRRREHPDWPINSQHVKSGGCWTAYEAEKLGKPVTWHVIQT